MAHPYVDGLAPRPWPPLTMHADSRTPSAGAALTDAMALVRTDELPDAVTRQLVPGFCRSAIEAACISLIRRRQLTAGIAHAEVEAAIAACRTTTLLASLALFDDLERGGEVMARRQSTRG